ncbi:MAG: hypothetical protein QX193_02265 [Methylococcales bacterium]
MKNIKLTDQNLNDLQVMLDYLLNSEAKSYEEYMIDEIKDKYSNDFIFDECVSSQAEINHIYAIAKRVKDAVMHSI